ncbi:MAG: fumarylacetoacetase [Pseudomonadota bacterium]
MLLMKSWVDSANSADCPFPLNNLPYGVYSTADLLPRCGVAIGAEIFDVKTAEAVGLISLADQPVFDEPRWNKLMALGQDAWKRLRARLIELLAAEAPDQQALVELLTPMTAATLHMPFSVAEFTDFYSGRHHAFNVGTMFRGPENALPPNWLHIPIGYNGRASSVVVSGTDVRRPWGQLKGPSDELPRFAPSERFDMELEMGAIVGTASQGPISVKEADNNIFGFVLLNDWSARDIQAWEYQPLGPFQAKATATSISPWIVTAAALEPFRCDAPEREFELLDYLKDEGPMLFDIDLEVTLAPEGKPPTTIARTNYNVMYYSAAQQLAHHTTSGCSMRTGDLLGSGTISGPQKHNRGSLLELSWGGKEPFALDGGETRSFIEDGDTLTLHAAAKAEEFQIGFGTCVGKVLPALDDPYSRN